MRRINCVFIIVNCLFISQCFCDSSVGEPEKLLSCFVNYLNNVPHTSYKYEDPILQLQETEPETKIEVKLKAIDLQNGDNVKIQKCHATLSGEGDCPEIVSHDCQDVTGAPIFEENNAITEPVVSETVFEQGPVNGQSHVHSDTAEVSEEQAVARPHVEPAVPCVGCSSHVNPQAIGVDQLANLGIRHLNKHEPDVKHSLNTVLDVERQVQVVNGVRYILTLDVEYNTCDLDETPTCVSIKTCKITVLEKPWKKLPDGSKYRAILSNNCTEGWLFGDDGEVIIDNTNSNNEDHEITPNTDIPNVISGEEVITVRNTNLQALPLHEKNLSDHEIKRLEEQIIPNNQLNQPYFVNEGIVKEKSNPEFAVTNTNTMHDNCQKKYEPSDSSKKAIDELINWFDEHYTIQTRDTGRTKRSYEVSSEDLTSTNLDFVGGPQLQDVKDPKFVDLANESLLKYLKSSGNQQQHAVVKIEKVTTQVVSGIKTVINFKISPTNCYLNSNGQTTNCNVIKDSNIKSCEAVIWEKPWKSFKDIDVKCSDIPRNSRAKRTTVGGEEEQDPNNSKYQILVDESLKKYSKDSRLKQYHKLIEIKTVTTQVVAGIMTRINFTAIAAKCKVDNNGLPTSSPCTSVGAILNCYSKIWTQPWKNFKEIDVTCGMDQKLRNKRGVGVPGGKKEQNPSDPKYITLAEESLQKFVQNSGTTQHHRVVEIKKVTSQVVSGSMTRMNFNIAPTNCKVDDKGQATSSNCEVVNGADIISCYSEVWEQPWKNFKDINVTCGMDQKLRNKRGIVLDRKTEQNPSDPKYTALAEESLQKFVQNSGTSQYHKVIQIQKVTRQVVSGSMTRINFTVVPTNCTVDANGQSISSYCEIDKNENILSCYSEIWEQPWNKFKQIDVNCTIDTLSRPKRDVHGGWTEQNSKDPRYSVLAEESVEKYLKISGLKIHHKVVDIHKATSQVVAGTLTLLEFKIAPTNCSINDNFTVGASVCEVKENSHVRHCRSKIWEKPWINFKEINVTCFDHLLLQNLAQESLQKLESLSLKQNRLKVLKINEYSTKVTVGKLTTINFDVGYTSCSKFESIDNLNSCELLTDVPVRHCVSTIWERSWTENGKVIDVSCEDNDTIIVDDSDTTNSVAAKNLANEALKHIEAKYPHPKKQKVVKIFSLEKQMIAGVHYRIKIEVGYTNCSALSINEDCELVTDMGPNKFCRVNVWLRPLNDHPPNFRVSCDNPQNATSDVYYHLQAEKLFSDFLSTYMPDYKDDLEKLEHRFQIFKENVKTIHDLNIHEKGTAKYGITIFSDLSREEFRNKYMGLKTSKSDQNVIPMRKADIPKVDLPQSFDWRDSGAVTEVKNQGSCGSCWAFSVTGNIEGQWQIKTGKLLSLSEQELVDCDKMDDGCNGGLPDTAYRAIEQMGGLMSEQDYPYEGDDEKCVFNKTLSKVQISGAVNISTNETDMAKWLVAHGPISIGINANAMQFYMGGVSHPWKVLCSPDNLDHGVLIVGYGEKSYPLFNKRLPYWVIKNSWGTMWGEQGYYRVYRGDGTCGVNMMASSAIV